MHEHDEDQMGQVFSDAYVLLIDRAPRAPTFEEITTIGVDPSYHSRIKVQWEDVERPAPSENGRWFGIAIAAAAAILVLISATLVADGNGDGVATDPASSPINANPVPPSSVAGGEFPPSVVDPASGYRWSRVSHDEAVFSGVGDQVMKSVTTGGPGFVAVGAAGGFDAIEESYTEQADAVVWTSVDGLAWARVPHDEAIFGGAAMMSVTAGGPGLVAVGTDPTNDAAAVWTSVDGSVWSRVAHDEALFGGTMRSVAVGGPGLVAMGWDASEIWTSVDGLIWSRVALDEAVFSEVVNSTVTAGGPGLVAVGIDWSSGNAVAAVLTSVDGIVWSRIPHDEAVFGGRGHQAAASAIAAGPGVVAVGTERMDLFGSDINAVVWTSVDGIVWSRVPHDETSLHEGQMVDAALGGPGLVTVGWIGPVATRGSDAAVWTSVDGTVWFRVAHDEALFGNVEMWSVAAAGSHVVAVGSDGADAAVWVGMPEN